MREAVTFTSRDVTLRGWKYYSGAHSGRLPAIVVAHGFSCTKEMRPIPTLAEAYAQAGFVVLAFDFRFLGESGGEPRGRIVVHEQLDDFAAAIEWVAQQPDVNSERIGIWGTSFASQLVITLGAFDPRVKVVVAQVPTFNNLAKAAKLRMGDKAWRDRLAMMVQDAGERRSGGAGRSIKVVAFDGSDAFLPLKEAYDFAMEAGSIVPTWRNEVTLDSLVLNQLERASSAHVDLIAPKPLLLQVARQDFSATIGHTESVFAGLAGPKRLDILDCGHFGVYYSPFLEQATASSTAWFREHL